ncbi:MAG: hypothetical protein H0T51_13430 [Pirellulales bacterium]|nr:hypothetical protein [Pirellulales bacterium]
MTLLGVLTPAGEVAAATGPAADRIYLISTRGIGTRCDCDAMAQGLRCEELVHDPSGVNHWNSLTWHELQSQLAEPLPTVVFVHGNRVENGEDKPHGLRFHRSLAARKPGDGPMRFIIWSWPSSQIRGVVNDYRVKAARTKPVGWQLAWALDQMPAGTPLALVGYSYGARVVTGTLHLLAGGRLGDLQLPERAHPTRRPVRAALVAAAVDANWIRPGGYHGRALEQVDQLLLVNNHLDPAMRFYHMAFEGKGRPLGYGGPNGLDLGEFAGRIRSIDVTGAVGRHHALDEYLAASGTVGPVLERVVELPALNSSDATLAGRATALQ